jgi:polysaccharide deacetylase family protein (PEP-CTERM system associated)
MTTHALTIDLEDWHQLLQQRVTGELIQPTTSVLTATHRVLDLLEEVNIRATFFIVGSIAETYPKLVREVAQRGHEIGSHTYAHKLIYRMEQAAFKADVERSLKQLQDLTGQPIYGFRAPEFSVGKLDHWCFEVLVELGFRYDSSVFPVSFARYGIPEAPCHPFLIATPAGTIQEFPLAIWETHRVRLPVAGGTYFRVLPVALLRRALMAIDTSGYTAVLYFHPYEFHTGLLYLSQLTWRQRLQIPSVKYTLLHNFCTGCIMKRLRVLLKEFHFMPLGEIYTARVAETKDSTSIFKSN